MRRRGVTARRSHSSRGFHPRSSQVRSPPPLCLSRDDGRTDKGQVGPPLAAMPLPLVALDSSIMRPCGRTPHSPAARAAAAGRRTPCVLGIWVVGSSSATHDGY